ncbi:MAG: bifunctional 5,10-methylenetetrahydrofolate dehydrogenase/5,10-methenyltetrahydrofolate cyclohydrolase [Oscillospiraceae bacterium]|nr:bifunctional 5,10-methylenetetrahydrofolate dehydrogenase/5,10-methenyltetrahydrofolate cyclohydrolase [Oscillospiraceae bacterium]
MSANILKGAAVAAALNEKTIEKCNFLKAKGTEPCLAIVRLGNRGDDIAYEKGILKRCEALGVKAERILLPEDMDENELINEIERLNGDKSIHGILVFMPLPAHINEKKVREAIAPHKDVDGVTSSSAAAVYTGSGVGFCPCTADAVMEILKFYGVEMAGKKAAVFGRSLVIGKPAAMLLMEQNATVTICHSRSAEPEKIAQDADIIVAAVGKAAALGKEYFRRGQTVIDVGINFNAEGKMCGDVDFSAAEGIVSAITPVPGGVGAVTTAVLLKHTVEAAEKYGDKS